MTNQLPSLADALRKFDRSSLLPAVNKAEASRQQITAQFPLDQWPSLALDRYALGGSNKRESFCWWMEFGSIALGGIGGGSAGKMLIYKSGDGTWALPAGFTNERVAWQAVRDGFVKAFSLAQEGRWSDIDHLPLVSGKAILLKALHLYFRDDVLPIYSRDHLLHWLIALGVPREKYGKLRRVELNRLLRSTLQVQSELAGWSTVEIARFLYQWAPPANWPGNSNQPQPPDPAFGLDACAAALSIELPELRSWVQAIKRKMQAVFYGPPGTGKTFVVEHLARHLISEGDGFCELVQFHPAYAYEDFIQGIRPKNRAGGGLAYPMVPGRFLEFCGKARARTGTCVLIVDEINRANLSRVFGELMYLLEYRDREIPLAGGGTLSIPQNVILLGTMNTADRSIALVDHALRRRFAFLALRPNMAILAQYHAREETGFDPRGLIEELRRLNDLIGDPNYAVGVTFFLRKDIRDELPSIWRAEIEPYLEEFFFGQPQKVDEFRWERIHARVLVS